MFVELHIIQSFAPSNLNRDDTNSPKDCEFGGVRRARISSQCIKRAIRTSPVFSEATAAETGKRTRWLTRLLQEPLLKSGKPEAEVEQVVAAFAEAYAGKMDPKQPERTSVLLYLSPQETQSIVDRLLATWDELIAALNSKEQESPEQAETSKRGRSGKQKKDATVTELANLVKDIVKNTQDRTSTPDIALFGRMLADKPELSLDAACQVAHALSTHRVTMEMDFFTAVDDLQQRDEAGAGMMGFTGFNSATFYRYSQIDWQQLVKNLAGDIGLARQTVEGFLRASVAAVPTGKQNSFAAHNPPSFLLAVVRDGDGRMGWNLANAFEKPIRATSDSGLVAPSIAKLAEHWAQMEAVYGVASLKKRVALPFENGHDLKTLQQHTVSNLDEWVEGVLSALSEERAE